MTEKFRNLDRRPAKPALGRGRVQNASWAAVIFRGGIATVSAVLDEVYGRRPNTRRSFQDGTYTKMRRCLDRFCDRVGRAATRGRPWLYRLRPGWGPPGIWDVMYESNGEWMRDANGELILRDPDLIGVHPDHEAEFRRGRGNRK